MSFVSVTAYQSSSSDSVMESPLQLRKCLFNYYVKWLTVRQNAFNFVSNPMVVLFQ